jgi:mannosyl-3-phosphoglycerate phosphatase
VTAPDDTPRAAVFTDLDGTLLDAVSYSWEPELAPQIGLSPPAIVENGAAIAWSLEDDDPPEAFAASYDELRDAFVTARRELALPLTGFGDVDTAGVVKATGLPSAAAERAKARVGDEPFWSERQLQESEISRLAARFAAAGLTLTRGGRFFHLHGKSDKGAAVRRILKRWPECRQTAGFGDAANDVPLLLAVRSRYAVRRPDGSVSTDLAAVPEVHVLESAGPEGFAEGAALWLAERHTSPDGQNE